MVSSQTIGEFALISEVQTVFWSTNASPNTIFSMLTVSCARSGAVTEPMIGLSLSLRCA